MQGWWTCLLGRADRKQDQGSIIAGGRTTIAAIITEMVPVATTLPTTTTMASDVGSWHESRARVRHRPTKSDRREFVRKEIKVRRRGVEKKKSKKRVWKISSHPIGPGKERMRRPHHSKVGIVSEKAVLWSVMASTTCTERRCAEAGQQLSNMARTPQETSEGS